MISLVHTDDPQFSNRFRSKLAPLESTSWKTTLTDLVFLLLSFFALRFSMTVPKTPEAQPIISGIISDSFIKKTAGIQTEIPVRDSQTALPFETDLKLRSIAQTALQQGARLNITAYFHSEIAKPGANKSGSTSNSSAQLEAFEIAKLFKRQIIDTGFPSERISVMGYEDVVNSSRVVIGYENEVQVGSNEFTN
jgi:flagellar motor protein MotB